MSAGLYNRPRIVGQIRQSRRAVIEASAGTGKTFAIEHLVLDLLLSGECTIDQILVVTFTEKATAELRSRVRRAIENILLGAADPEPAQDTEPVVIDMAMRGRLEDAWRGFDGAPIFTIHGFCHRVLTDFAFQSGTMLELELADSRGEFHRAFRAELRDHLAKSKETGALLEKMLAGFEPDKPQGMSADDIERLLYEAYRRRYLQSPECGGRLRSAQDLLATYDANLLKREFQRAGLKHAALQSALEIVEEIADGIKDARGSGERLLEHLSQVELKPLVNPILTQDKGRHFSGQARRLARLIDQAGLAAKSEPWKLVELFLPVVAARLQREKLENGKIDFDDMLAWVSRALEGCGGEALATALQDRFRCALIDEFQDTDDLQWGIFGRLFASGASNRLYVVGDPKQAIYAFRGADVFTYLRAHAELTKANPAIQLLDNFRSTSDLIDACNHVFDQKAPQPLFDGKIGYDHAVRCGRPDRRALDRKGQAIAPVILMRYQNSGGEPSPVAEIRSAIGRHIAEQLNQILTADAQTITVQDKNQRRQVRPRDVFVLTRTRQESAEIGAYLAEANVPFKFYKQEGLFQTPEATHVLDVLRAVAQPHLRSNRLKAWVSPFFGVPLRDLALIDEVMPADPLNERLYEWKSIAERGRLAELFDALLHQSGVTARELFLTGSERRLTNYQHVFELLLTAATARQLDLEELITLLEDYIAERALPEVDEPNTQRQESEREAVSVLTVHMSKGLEADVVVLFGGFGRIPDFNSVAVYHDDAGERHFAIGKSAKSHSAEQRTREQEDEDVRLLYVGLTRARARVYLPLMPAGSFKGKKLQGYYGPLNTRLLEIEQEIQGGKSKRLAKLFAIQEVAQPSAEAQGGDKLSKRLAAWTPAPSLIEQPTALESEGALRNLRRRHWPLVMRSYTSLRRAEEQGWDIAQEEFKRDLESGPEAGDLPGGREVGLFLHEVIEKSAMEPFAEAFEDWRQREDVTTLFRAAMRRHQVKEPWFDRGLQVVFAALTTPIALPDNRIVGPLYKCHSVREMELVYPIPESHHPLLATPAQGKWTVDRGYLKGFVDFVFEKDGLIYFADWKSDQLSKYESAQLEQHVREHYWIQAQIYSIGVLRLLQIRDEREYQRRFGGLLYVFLRGLDDGGRRGIYFHRPAWSEVRAYESDLMRTISAGAA